MGRNRGGGGQQKKAMKEVADYLSDMEGSLGQWPTDNLVNSADKVGAELKERNITTTQIRNFLDEVNRLDAEARKGRANFEPSEVVFLNVQLAYAAGREQSLKPFYNLFSTAVGKVSTDEENFDKDFDRFVKFTRAVVAYHRFHGGGN